MGSKEVTYLDVDIGNVQGSTNSEKIEYLASLIHGTSVIATDLGTLFSQTASREGRSQEHTLLIASYMKGGGHQIQLSSSDPPLFCVQPSNHLRTFDSMEACHSAPADVDGHGAKRSKISFRLDCLSQSWLFQPM